MSRHHHTPPTGRRRDRQHRRTDDFWGDTADWPTSEIPVVAPRERIETLEAPVDHDRYAELGEPVDDDLLSDERWDAAWEPEPRPTPGIDPFVLRVGAAVVALTLAVPLFLGFRSDGDDTAAIQTTGAAADAAATSPTPTTVPGSIGDAPTGSTGTTDDVDDATTTADGASVVAADETDPAPTCGIEYVVAAGDFWIRIADGAGVELAALLDVNDATVDTPLFPGSSICLPDGASTPPPPEAPAALTADEPNTVTSGATASAVAEPVPAPRTPPPPPPTTAAPTTTAPPPPSDVVSIIRSVWPDDLEDRAITIAWRESNHRPDADNGFCCYGLFQIYYDVHKSWLASDLGITSAQQLFDPVLNARAAYRLYERAGGWGPWSQTNY